MKDTAELFLWRFGIVFAFESNKELSCTLVFSYLFKPYHVCTESSCPLLLSEVFERDSWCEMVKVSYLIHFTWEFFLPLCFWCSHYSL